MELATRQFDSHGLAEQDDAALMDRVDRKYILPVSELSACLAGLTDSYTVLEIDGRRQFRYDTLYFDTECLAFYKAHHNGKLNRQKVRLRHYRDSRRLFLEVKLKNSRARTVKKRLDLSTPWAGETDIPGFLKATLYSRPEALTPSLFVGYRRITLMNRQRTERVTLDTGLRFRSCRSSAEADLPGLAIVEVKTDRKALSSGISSWFKARNIHPIRVSKYCTGIAMAEPAAVKHNAFKPTLKKIDTITRSVAHDLCL